MSINIDGKTYYRTNEACEMVGISKGTLFRWIREKIIEDAKTKDRNGWRMFTAEEVAKIREEANRVV